MDESNLPNWKAKKMIKVTLNLLSRYVCVCILCMYLFIYLYYYIFTHPVSVHNLPSSLPLPLIEILP